MEGKTYCVSYNTLYIFRDLKQAEDFFSLAMAFCDPASSEYSRYAETIFSCYKMGIGTDGVSEEVNEISIMGERNDPELGTEVYAKERYKIDKANYKEVIKSYEEGTLKKELLKEDAEKDREVELWVNGKIYYSGFEYDIDDNLLMDVADQASEEDGRTYDTDEVEIVYLDTTPLEENVEESITLRRKNTNISNIIMESLKRK